MTNQERRAIIAGLRQATVRLIRERGLANVSLEDMAVAAGFPAGSWRHITGQTPARWLLEASARGHYGPALPVIKGRTDPHVLTVHLLTIALELATAKGYKSVTRADIAARAKLHPATVHRLFPSCDALDRAVMAAARDRNCLPVLAQGLAHRHPVALRAPEAQRQAAALWVAGGAA